jgi:hypothetical protein
MTTQDDQMNRNLPLFGMTPPDNSRNLPRSRVTYRSLLLWGAILIGMAVVQFAIGPDTPVIGSTMGVAWGFVGCSIFMVALVERQHERRIQRLEEQLAQKHPRP